MQGSVLSFLKAEWKVSDTGSAHWASSLVFDFTRSGIEHTIYSTEGNHANQYTTSAVLSVYYYMYRILCTSVIVNIFCWKWQ